MGILSINAKLGTGRAKCWLCNLPIGKNQPTLQVTGPRCGLSVHGLAQECPAMCVSFRLKV